MKIFKIFPGFHSNHSCFSFVTIYVLVKGSASDVGDPLSDRYRAVNVFYGSNDEEKFPLEKYISYKPIKEQVLIQERLENFTNRRLFK